MKIHLKIKFRAFFIDFLKIDETFDLASIGIVVPPIGKRVLYDSRGVLLEVL